MKRDAGNFIKHLRKIISLVFLGFPALNVLVLITHRENRQDFALLRESTAAWISFLMAAMLVIILLLLFFGKLSAWMRGKKWLRYAVISSAALVPRLLAVSAFQVSPASDFKLYHDIASGLLRGEVFARGYIALFPHTFGYPAVLSLFYRIFGPHYHAGQALNILAGIGISVMLYRTGSILFSEKAGFAAALFWALWPSQVLYSLLLSTEALFTFLMLLVINLFLYVIRKRPRNKTELAALGLLCAYTNCIRPFGIILILSFIIVIVLDDRAYERRFSGKIAAKTLPCLLLALSYSVSSFLFGIGLSGIIQKEIAGFPVGFNLLTGSNIKYSGTWNIEDSQILLSYASHESFKAQEVQSTMMDLAIRRYRIMWASDDEVISYIRAGLMEATNGWARFSGMERYLRLACNGYYFAMTCLCLVFSIRIFRRVPDHSCYVAPLFILGTATAHLVLEAAGRYHYPVVSLVALLAGAGAEHVLSRIRSINPEASTDDGAGTNNGGR